MKKLLLFVLLLAAAAPVMGQAAVAKVKYEEAEEAFAAGNYTATLVKLDEAQDMLGATNPKLLYLRIMAQAMLIRQNPYGDYRLLESARKNSAFYLKQYADYNVEASKFRDVYDVSEGLKKYPQSAAAFAAQKESYEAQAAKEMAKARAAAVVIGFAQALGEQYGFKPGLTRSEFLSFNRRVGSAGLTNVVQMGSSTGYTRKLKSVAAVFAEGPASYSVNSNGIVYSYSDYIQSGKNNPQASIALFDKLKAQLKDALGSALVTLQAGSTPTYQRLIVAVPVSAENPDKIRYYVHLNLNNHKNLTYVNLYMGPKSK